MGNMLSPVSGEGAGAGAREERVPNKFCSGREAAVVAFGQRPGGRGGFSARGFVNEAEGFHLRSHTWGILAGEGNKKEWPRSTRTVAKGTKPIFSDMMVSAGSESFANHFLGSFHGRTCRLFFRHA